MFSSKSFIVSSLIFRSLIHFEFIFMYGVRKCSSSILLHVTVQFSQHHLLAKLSFIHCTFLPPCQRRWKCSSSFLLHVTVQFSQHHLLARLSFIHHTFLPPYQREGVHRYVGLSQDFISCSFDLYFCFCASTVLSRLLQLCGFGVQSNIRKTDSSNSVFLS